MSQLFLLTNGTNQTNQNQQNWFFIIICLFIFLEPMKPIKPIEPTELYLYYIRKSFFHASEIIHSADKYHNDDSRRDA